jgi:hypothetical protein
VLTIDLAAITSGTVIVGLRRPGHPESTPARRAPTWWRWSAADRQFGEQLLYRADLDGLSLQKPGSRCSFDADAREFQLAAEAMRIRLAGRHDPTLVVSSSEIDPLPPDPRGG